MGQELPLGISAHKRPFAEQISPKQSSTTNNQKIGTFGSRAALAGTCERRVTGSPVCFLAGVLRELRVCQKSSHFEKSEFLLNFCGLASTQIGGHLQGGPIPLFQFENLFQAVL